MSLNAKLQGVKPVFHKHTIVTFIRETTANYLEASPDFGQTWVKFPVSEIDDAEVIKQVPTAKGSFPLVRLLLKEDHPTIEIAALRAQVRFLTAGGNCSCNDKTSSIQPTGGTYMMPLQCGSVCAGETGCDWWACVYWCGFLR